MSMLYSAHFDILFYPQPGTDDAYEEIVDSGRVLLARQLAEGSAFQLTTFAIGTGGIDWSKQPPRARPVDSSLTTLENEVFRNVLSTPVSYPAPGFYSVYFRVPADSFTGVVGEYGIIATITASINPKEVGVQTLFAVGHIPPFWLTAQSVMTRRVVISA